MRLFHVSETPAISRFEPRVSSSRNAGANDKIVWAVDDYHLVNYLLPRECPRVTFYPRAGSNEEDISRFFGLSSARHVVAIEGAWLQRVIASVLWVYEFTPEHFEVVDQGAGYFVSRRTEVPIGNEKLEHPLDAILKRGAEVRLVPSLWPLQDAVIQSSLQFSCIRMRNALPREAPVIQPPLFEPNRISP